MANRITSLISLSFQFNFDRGIGSADGGKVPRAGHSRLAPHCTLTKWRLFSPRCSDVFSLSCRVDRKLNSTDVLDALTDLFVLRGLPSFIRSAYGPEFVAQAVQDWIKAVGAKTAYIEPGSPSENGYCESFNAQFAEYTQPSVRDPG